MRLRSGYIEITNEMYDTLKAHKNRTGMGAIVIHDYMKGKGMLPENITVQRIDSWFSRIAKSVKAKDFDAVLRAYEGIKEDYVDKNIPRTGTLREPVTPEFLKQLKQAFKKRTNFSAKTLLKHPDTPSKLTQVKLSNILKGRTKTIPKSHRVFLEKVVLNKGKGH